MCAVLPLPLIEIIDNHMIMKLKTNHLTCALVALFALLTASCSTEGVSPVGIRTDALDDAAWDSSVWISAADADVVTGKISGKNFLAADGYNNVPFCIDKMDTSYPKPKDRSYLYGFIEQEILDNVANLAEEVYFTQFDETSSLSTLHYTFKHYGSTPVHILE